MKLNSGMTSMEIAELVGALHDKVKQSIERLANRMVIELPPMGKFKQQPSRSLSTPLKVSDVSETTVSRRIPLLMEAPAVRFAVPSKY